MDKIPVRHITSSFKEPDLSGSFSIRDIETLLSGRDMIQELHRHSFFYVLVLQKGRGEHYIDFVSYTIGDYTIFFMRPGQVHQLVLKKGSKGFLMGFTDDFYAPFQPASRQVLRKVSHKSFCSLDAKRFKKLLSILEGIFKEHASKQERYLEVIRSSLDIFFIELLRQSRDPRDLSIGSGEYQQERLEELQELIALHIAEHKEVGYYAEQMHQTHYQLNAITKATLGKTCSAVINDYIILEARRRLLATSSQINQVAWELGYEDVSYFIRFFKKHTGHTPESYRRNFK
ncbi:MAG TPA: AraC family transcriptional regulator [Puia sp.]|jgi:AraC-like DNA-binding protein|nr:AraC family transcriptional regulator [Puia sp.]